MDSEKYQMLAKTFSGLEEVLKQELVELGASEVEQVVRGVSFTGNKELLYKANFCCRTATRVLRIIGEFPVKSTNDLYQSVYKIPWEEIFELTQTFAINSTVNSEAFNNSMFVSLKTKDAIVDRFRNQLGKRPSVNTENPDIWINVHASADSLTVSLDSSGASLHKRGYRVAQNEASMNEVLAAGILKIAGWKGESDFYDTMCGSGTIAIEAALMALNIPPGIYRQSFAFETWKDFDQDLFGKVYNEDYEKPFEHAIYASDVSALSLKVAQKNAKSAGVHKSITFKEIDFADFEPAGDKGLLIINPPYGERLNERRVEPLYEMIGDRFKQAFAGFQTWVFSSSELGFKHLGLRPSAKIPLYNGALPCSFRAYEVYEGSKKAKKQGGDSEWKRENPRQDQKSFVDRKDAGRPSKGEPKKWKNRDDRNSDSKFAKRRPEGKSSIDRRPRPERGQEQRQRPDRSQERRPHSLRPQEERPTNSVIQVVRKESVEGKKAVEFFNSRDEKYKLSEKKKKRPRIKK